MTQRSWDLGEDDEELLEYAMHPPQYEDFKSGKAKTRFEEDLAKRKQKVNSVTTAPTTAPAATAIPSPKEMTIKVDGRAYRVSIDYGHEEAAPTPAASPSNGQSQPTAAALPASDKAIMAPLEGKFLLTKDSQEVPIKIGDQVAVGDTVAYIESMKVINAIVADQGGEVVDILAQHGSDIEEDAVIIQLR